MARKEPERKLPAKEPKFDLMLKDYEAFLADLKEPAARRGPRLTYTRPAVGIEAAPIGGRAG
jgi:hypothetical protein